MNAQTRPSAAHESAPGEFDRLREARRETFRLLQTVIHYAELARGHLYISDDPVAVYDFEAAKRHFEAAARAFEIVRAAMRQRVETSEGPSR